MANLSQEKRGNLISRINKLKEHADEDTVLLLNEIVNELTNKKYGLVWEDHSEKVDEMMSDNIPVFTEDKSKEIVSDKNLPYNFILEGDNLHSLYLLEKTHKGIKTGKVVLTSQMSKIEDNIKLCCYIKRRYKIAYLSGSRGIV